MRRALQHKSVFAVLTFVLFVGGSLAVTAFTTSGWAFFGFIFVIWAALMYVLRWRKG
jgi:hypothetical protein